MRAVTALGRPEQSVQMREAGPRLAESAVDAEGFELARQEADASSMSRESALQKRSGAKGELVEPLRGYLEGVSHREKRLVGGEPFDAASMTHHPVS
jgi:hypothetical protein